MTDATDPYEPLRRRMVMDQCVNAPHPIRDSRVIDAMLSVPRHEFVPKDSLRLAYADTPLPIGFGQTISQPYIVAYMTERLRLQPGDKVLEIGFGSGYQTAVLARLDAIVYGVEIVAPLVLRARAALERLGVQARLKCGDGRLGWPQHAPYDAVIAACAPTAPPPALISQLKDGGRLVMPVGDDQRQRLTVFVKRGDAVSQESELPVRFVPMTGGESPAQP